MSLGLWLALHDDRRHSQNMKAAEDIKRPGHKKNTQKVSVT